MNLFNLSWKYLKAKPLNSFLSLILVALGTSLTSVLLLINNQFSDRLYKNIDGINLVVGAKGSPLQMILSSVYHISPPTGNIPLSEAPYVTKNPYFEKTIPLSLGDSYKAHKIVGTDSQYIAHYGAELHVGRLNKHDMEVVIGGLVAKRLGLNINDEFYGSHGLVEDGGHVHDNYAYRVVGILERSNTVLDQLIITNLSSVWRVHEGHDHEHGEEGSDSTHQHSHGQDNHSHGQEDHGHGHRHDDHGHDHHGHDHHGHHHEAPTVNEDLAKLPTISSEGKDITAYLCSYKKAGNGKVSTVASIEGKKIILDNTQELGVAQPAYELNKLLEMTGVGVQFLNALTWIIILISAFSVFISLYVSLKERRYEVALMRVMGASRKKIFMMVILEGLMIAALGFILGISIAHIGMAIMSVYLQDAYQYAFSGLQFFVGELYLGIGSLAIGFLAALLPALQGYKIEISDTLSQK